MLTVFANSKYHQNRTFYKSIMEFIRFSSSTLQQECILFCAGKTRVISNWSDLFLSHMLWSCQFPVRVVYLLKFLRHLLFTQLQISRVMTGRMVSIVSKHEGIPEWMCFSEKADQALVVSLTTD